MTATAMEIPTSPEVTNNKIDQIFFDYASKRDLRLRNKIAQQNQALVTYIINKYYSNKKEYSLLKEDMMQEGIIGLLSAIDGYKPELGYRFSTYSTWWIRQAINNYLLNVEPIIHIPSHVRTANNKIQKKLREENLLLQDYIDDYGNGENDEYTLKMLKSISMANRSKNITSIDETHNGSGDNDNSPMLKNVLLSDEDIETKYCNHEMLAMVETAINMLTEKERYILLLRFDIIKEIP
jgi:RNA polymerase nonessential primary-like sigma factor